METPHSEDTRALTSAARAITLGFYVDPEWLEAYRSGERQVFERVYRAHVGPIERYVRSLARSSATPELGQASAIADFVQEIFTRTFSASARRNYDGRRDLGGYLTAIARNCFVDALRARRRDALYLRRASILSVEYLDREAAGLDDTVDPRLGSVVANYLVGLPSDLRQIYERRFGLGRSQDDTCADLGLSRRALRTKEGHLRKGLRRALVKAGVSLAELHSVQTT